MVGFVVYRVYEYLWLQLMGLEHTKEAHQLLIRQLPLGAPLSPSTQYGSTPKGEGEPVEAELVLSRETDLDTSNKASKKDKKRAERK